MLLFVYGTLKRGQRNHRLLADQRFVRPTATAVGFRLYDLGPFPGMVRHPGGGSVRGELYEVSDECWAELEEFEDVPELFVGRRIELEGGERVAAFLFAQSVAPNAPHGDEWPFE